VFIGQGFDLSLVKRQGRRFYVVPLCGNKIHHKLLSNAVRDDKGEVFKLKKGLAGVLKSV